MLARHYDSAAPITSIDTDAVGPTGWVPLHALRRRPDSRQPPRPLHPKASKPPGIHRAPAPARAYPLNLRKTGLAYARTDMRSQGRTEQRALLALDGKEDKQGFYVQVSRSIERTDLYLTVGPEPLALEEAHPHPKGERLEPEQLLGRVMTRDGGKTLAGDTPTAVDVRRLSTKQLRQRRDELVALRASCPPDRSRELQRARERAVDLEQARRAAQAEHQAAAAALAAAGGRLLRRREQAVARDRVTLAEHALKTVSGQVEHASERVGVLRRTQQQRAGWLEQHHDLPALERANARELAWRQRVDERAMVLTQPGWLIEALGPLPPAERPAEQRAWLAAAVALDGYRRAYGLDDQPPAKHGAGERTWAGRDGLAATVDQAGRPTPVRAAAGDQPQVGDEVRRGRPGWRHSGRERAGRRPERPTLGQERAGRVAELLGAEPGRRQAGPRRDWQQVQAALERLERVRTRDPDRHHDRAHHRDREQRGHGRDER